jgi:DNA (cytosine-5)-methyltransferase 1
MADKSLDEAPIWTDLKQFDGKPWRGVVDCVVAGWPCQPFSVIGQKAGADDPRHLWPQVARIVRECEPSVVFGENVPNHLNIGFSDVRRELRDMGYVVEAGLFAALELGGSHVRERIYALGNSTRRPFLMPIVGQGGPVQAGGRGPGLGGEGDEGPEALPVFPPGPESLADWEKILEVAPYLKPGFLDVADELASGLDESDAADRQARLRVVGNGVVPSCAAYAFNVLLSRIRAEE